MTTPLPRLDSYQSIYRCQLLGQASAGARALFQRCCSRDTALWSAVDLEALEVLAHLAPQGGDSDTGAL